MGEVIPFAEVLDRRRRDLVTARPSGWAWDRYVRMPAPAIGLSPAEYAAGCRYFEGVVNYFETGRPPAFVAAR
jgi:hypothetical protein